MSEEGKDGLPAADAQVPETTEQSTTPAATLPDEPASEVETLKAETATLREQLKAAEAEKVATAQRLKDNQDYISRTRNVEKAAETQRPQKTLEDYIGEVKTKFQDDPAAGLEKVIRDIAYDRDLERQEKVREIAAAEDRAFKKMLALNPESSKTLKEIEKLDEECPDLQGLSYERKVEFINLRNAGATNRAADVRGKIGREAGLAGGVGGSTLSSGRERIPAWVNDPEAVAALGGKFATKQEALIYANPESAKRAYEEKMAKQRKGQLA